jgi:PTS system fructose-specific IIC component
MGGPVNKAAYAFAVAGLGTATVTNTVPLTIMAAVMAAGMVPPLALGVATFVRGRLFSEVERENGKAAIPLGAAFITEGAIPFAAADPLRVIPPIMVASSVTGAIVMVSEVTLRAPHGGIFVFFAMTKVWVFVLALAIGTVIGAAGVVFAKTSFGRKDPLVEAREIDLRAAETAADPSVQGSGTRPAHA